jgi:flagellar assembly protein FliH
MSTSFSPAHAGKRSAEVHAFMYAEVPSAEMTSVTAEAASGALADIAMQREAAAREAGRQEGEGQARAEAGSHLAEIREAGTANLVEFAHQRAEYFRQVESEVVQLALSIARRILHREAHTDPQLLPALVRITLEKMETATQVVVRANPQQVSEYRGYFARHMEASRAPEVMEDAAIEMDRCVLQTALGITNVGIEVQLTEIEKGLFDLLEKRPTGI